MRISVGKRPRGVTALVIMGLLVTIGQFITALRLINLLPFAHDGGGRSLGHWIGATLYLVIVALNLLVLRGLWTLEPAARKRVITSIVINGVLALLAVLSPATIWQSLPALAINAVFFVYCRSEGVRRAFGEA